MNALPADLKMGHRYPVIQNPITHVSRFLGPANRLSVAYFEFKNEKSGQTWTTISFLGNTESRITMLTPLIEVESTTLSVRIKVTIPDPGSHSGRYIADLGVRNLIKPTWDGTRPSSLAQSPQRFTSFDAGGPSRSFIRRIRGINGESSDANQPASPPPQEKYLTYEGLFQLVRDFCTVDQLNYHRCILMNYHVDLLPGLHAAATLHRAVKSVMPSECIRNENMQQNPLTLKRCPSVEDTTQLMMKGWWKSVLTNPSELAESAFTALYPSYRYGNADENDEIQPTCAHDESDVLGEIFEKMKIALKDLTELDGIIAADEVVLSNAGPAQPSTLRHRVTQFFADHPSTLSPQSMSVLRVISAVVNFYWVFDLIAMKMGWIQSSRRTDLIRDMCNAIGAICTLIYFGCRRFGNN